MNERATRVVVADDEILVRMGLRMLLDDEEDLFVVAEAADGRAAVAAAQRTEADVVVMDIRMPVLDGLQAARALREADSPTRILVLTTFDDDATVDAAIRAGVAGFLLKTAPPEQLLHAVRQIAQGRGALDPAVVPRLLTAYERTAAPTRPGSLDRLTDRELEVLQLIALGMSNAEVAARLFLGETTVKTHLSRVLSKLHIPDRQRLVAWAWQHGIAHAEH